MSDSIRIDICICTFRRMHIADTLASLATIEIPLHTSMHIIIADNDDTPSAQSIVKETAEKCGLNVSYLHAPARNISIARNACLDAATGDFVAFIDDDEIVTPQWLVALLNRHRESNAPIILGPMQAIYPKGCKPWLVAGDFHSTKPVWAHNKIITGYTTNVLMLRTHPALSGLRFRVDLGVSGGEDSDFFSRAYTAGALIDYAPDAITYEGIPDNRATLRWLLKRRYRYGQTHAMMLREANRGGTLGAAKAAIKAIYSGTMMIFTCLSPVKLRFWMIRAALHIGVAHTLATRPPSQQ